LEPQNIAVIIEYESVLEGENDIIDTIEAKGR